MTDFIQLLELFNILTEQTGKRILMTEIKEKEGELRVSFPKELIDFYLTVGHNKIILNKEFLELKNIYIQDNQLVIGKYKKGKIFGVIVNEAKFLKIDEVIYYDNKCWHPDMLNLNNTLIMEASENVINNLKYIADTQLPKEFRNSKEKVIEHLMPEFVNCELIKGGKCGLFIHKEQNCLAWYMRGTNKLLIGSKKEEQLKSLVQDKQLIVKYTIIDGIKLKDKK